MFYSEERANKLLKPAASKAVNCDEAKALGQNDFNYLGRRIRTAQNEKRVNDAKAKRRGLLLTGLPMPVYFSGESG